MSELFVVLHNMVLTYLLVVRCENVLHITCTYCDAIGMEMSCVARCTSAACYMYTS